MNMKQPAGRWTVFTMLGLALSILVLTGAGLYANDLVIRTGDKISAASASCPLPSADFPKKEKKTMTTTVQKEMIPLMDRAVPARTETATFGLG